MIGPSNEVVISENNLYRREDGGGGHSCIAALGHPISPILWREQALDTKIFPAALG